MVKMYSLYDPACVSKACSDEAMTAVAAPGGGGGGGGDWPDSEEYPPAAV